MEESEKAEKEAADAEEEGGGKKKKKRKKDKKDKKDKKKKTDKEEEEDLNSDLMGATEAKDLAPYATSISDTSMMSPLSRAKALMSMMEGGAPVEVDKKDKEGDEGEDDDEASAYDDESGSEEDR